eukprot:5451186-Amphidinium_carterae.1
MALWQHFENHSTELFRGCCANQKLADSAVSNFGGHVASSGAKKSKNHQDLTVVQLLISDAGTVATSVEGYVVQALMISLYSGEGGSASPLSGATHSLSSLRRSHLARICVTQM